MSKKEPENKQSAGYTKQQFLSSKKLVDKSDLLNALLEDGKTYTSDQVDKLIEDFLKKEVK